MVQHKIMVAANKSPFPKIYSLKKKNLLLFKNHFNKRTRGLGQEADLNGVKVQSPFSMFTHFLPSPLI